MGLAEGVSLVATVVSTVAALLGLWISYLQWRSVRSGSPAPTPRPAPPGRPPPGRPPPGPPPAPPAPAGRDALARRALVTVLLGTTACTLFAVVFLLNSVAGEDRDAVLTPPFVLGMIATVVATVLAVVVLVRAAGLRRGREARTAVLGLVLAWFPWVALYVLT